MALHLRAKKKCQPMECIKNMIKINNVTTCNCGNIALSVIGCFNVSVEKLTCSNITWKKQELFTFRGDLLNTKNILIKNAAINNNMKYNKSERKVFFSDSRETGYAYQR